MTRRIKIELPKYKESVSGLINIPEGAFCLMAFAHGAGVGMEHLFMSNLADTLAAESIGTLRFNFLYMEKGSRRPDFPYVAHRVMRAALSRASIYGKSNNLPVMAGGKSFGARMFSQLAAKSDDPGFEALVCFGFPLHPPGKPGTTRADHLSNVKVPMLFLQGTRDTLAQESLIKDVSHHLRRATLIMIKGADHSFHMLKRSGVSDEEIIRTLAQRTAIWLRKKLK